jgi:hypothetical protein
MKYISLAFHNNELVLISGMDEFASHFCYSKKQRQGAVVDVAPPVYIDGGAGLEGEIDSP